MGAAPCLVFQAGLAGPSTEHGLGVRASFCSIQMKGMGYESKNIGLLHVSQRIGGPTGLGADL